jgi:hypothetical protein
MRLCNAWPEACSSGRTQTATETVSQTDQVMVVQKAFREDKGPVVLPKGLLEETVERSVEQLLEEQWGPSKQEVPNTKRAKQVVPAVQESEPVASVSTAPLTTLYVTKQEMHILWAVFAIFVFFMFLVALSIFQRVQTLEAWLHGRLMSAP